MFKESYNEKQELISKKKKLKLRAELLNSQTDSLVKGGLTEYGETRVVMDEEYEDYIYEKYNK